MKPLKKIIILFILSLTIGILAQEDELGQQEADLRTTIVNIRNVNGKFYAYIQLLFNENPHFVNLVQEGSIPYTVMQTPNYHLIAYNNYLKNISTAELRQLAKYALDIYSNPSQYSNNDLEQFAKKLEQRDIIIRFSKNKSSKITQIILDYCIYGKREPLKIKHPFIDIKENIYTIQPLIDYDEFSTSNSTFYFDMIYINPDEVKNDYRIAQMVLEGKEIRSLFFVGSRVTDEIKDSLKKAFPTGVANIDELWHMFEVHELTHKILNNDFNDYDQVIGEELALSSTIYDNPYLGLAVLYSYLDYNTINPHRIGAMNYVKFVAQEKGDKNILENPALLKDINANELKRITKLHFTTTIGTLKKVY